MASQCVYTYIFEKLSWSLMPQLHLPRLSYDLFVYDFLYDFLGIVGGYKLRRMCLHCLRSPYDFFRRQTRTKLYRDLADIVRQPQGYRTTIVLSKTPALYKSHNARTMTLLKSQGVGTLTVQLSCNYVHGFKRLSTFNFCIPFELCFKVM